VHKSLQFCCAVSIAGAALCPMAASAVEGGISPYLKGSAGFMAGFLPPSPGLYFSNLYYYFNGTVARDVRGGDIELGADGTINLVGIEGIANTGLRFMGGDYAVGALIDVANVRVKSDLQTPIGGVDIDRDDSDLGDSLFMPVMLGWHDGYWHWTFSFPVLAPTGNYNLHDVSTGKNVWGLMPEFAVTYFDQDTGWEASGALSYVVLFNNAKTDYDSGDLVHFDFAAGFHNGVWEIGIAGNLMEQVTGDSGAGAVLGPFKAESFGLGPAVTYAAKWRGVPVNFSGKWEHDLSSNNTLKGDVVTFYASIPL
jgi:hypothetical protein